MSFTLINIRKFFVGFIPLPIIKDDQFQNGHRNRLPHILPNIMYSFTFDVKKMRTLTTQMDQKQGVVEFPATTYYIYSDNVNNISLDIIYDNGKLDVKLNIDHEYVDYINIFPNHKISSFVYPVIGILERRFEWKYDYVTEIQCCF